MYLLHALLIVLIIIILFTFSTYVIRDIVFITVFALVGYLAVQDHTKQGGNDGNCAICWGDPSDDDWAGWSEKHPGVCNTCALSIIFAHEGVLNKEVNPAIVEYSSNDEQCGPFYHEFQFGDSDCTLYAINNMYGKHVVDSLTPVRMFRVINNPIARKWIENCVAKYASSNASLRTKNLMRELMYNLDYTGLQAMKTVSNDNNFDFITQLFLASFIIEGDVLKFQPMEVVRADEMTIDIDRAILNSDTICTKDSIGHAVALRRVGKCTDIKYNWMIINSKSTKQTEVNAEIEFKACISAYPKPYPIETLSIAGI